MRANHKKYQPILALIATCLLSSHALAAGPALPAYPVVDTGQTACYDNSRMIACPAPNQAFYGQDAQTAGIPFSYRDNGDGTVSDLSTGLMWVRDRGSKLSWDQAMAGAAGNRTGGYGDWRMPTVKELYSLIDFKGKSGKTSATSIPYLDTRYFGFAFGDTSAGERLIDAQDWSATEYIGVTMMNDATVFGVNFIDGRIKGYPKFVRGAGGTQPNRLYVRYVRGNSAYGVNNFADNGNNTLSDRASGLMWSRTDSGSAMNWEDTLTWVQNKNRAYYLGYNDWRLPNAKELQSIVDYTRAPDVTASPALHPLFASTAIANEGNALDYPFYWTGTTHLDNGGAVYFAFGRALGYMKFGASGALRRLDVHGAGAQRSDPKSGLVANYLIGYDSTGNAAYGLGPQGDVIRITNFARLVRNAR